MMVVALAMMGSVVAGWLAARVTRDAVCVRLILGAYGVNVALASLLYMASLHHWPLFVEQQVGPGFWQFAQDAQYHHDVGRDLAQAWREGMAVSTEGKPANWWFILYVGLVYRVLGAHPLHVAVLNAWYNAVMVCSGVSMLTQWSAPKAAVRFGAAVLGFWPSLLLWSSQVLKDPMVLALIMLGLAAVIHLVRWPAASRPVMVGSLVCVAGVTVALRLLREFTGLAFAITVVAAAVVWWVQALRRKAAGGSGRVLGMAVAISLAFLLAGYVDAASAMWSAPRPAQSSPGTGGSEAGRSVLVIRGDADSHPMPNTLRNLRKGFIDSGGSSRIDPEVRMDTIWDVVKYLPRGLAVAFLAPFPWHWSEQGGQSGIFRTLASIEVALVYLLLLDVLLRPRDLRKSLGPQMAIVWLFIVLMIVPMSLTVANLGTLFRLRLQFLMPLMLLVSSADPLGRYASQRVGSGNGSP